MEYRVSRHLYDRFLGPAREKMNQVHRIAGGHYAHKITGDLHIVLACLLLNDAKSTKHNAFGFLDPGTGRRAAVRATGERYIRK